MERELVAGDPWIDPPPWRGPPPAAFRARARAALLDAALSLTPLWVGLVVLAAGERDAGALLMAAAFASWLLYPVLLISRRGESNGQTPGKRHAGVRVVRDDGLPIGLGFALKRELLVKGVLFLWIGGLFVFIPWLYDRLSPLWDEQRRALHDTIVGTHVVAAG